MTNLQALNVYKSYVEAWKPISDTQRSSILSEVFDENVDYLVPQYVGGVGAAIEEAVSRRPFRNRKCLHPSRGRPIQVGAHSAGWKGHGERP